MNMCCERCGRDDICLCNLPEDPTAAAVEILDAARALVLADMRGLPEHDEQPAAVISANAQILTDAIVRLQGADGVEPGVDLRR